MIGYKTGRAERLNESAARIEGNRARFSKMNGNYSPRPTFNKSTNHPMVRPNYLGVAFGYIALSGRVD